MAKPKTPKIGTRVKVSILPSSDAKEEVELDYRVLMPGNFSKSEPGSLGAVKDRRLRTIGRKGDFKKTLQDINPKLNLIVPMGDGDALAIGGNHFIHAARRNIDITAIVMNNRIYGMTGGQYSPLSWQEVVATTAPFASIDPSFDVVELSKAAGATFIARTTSYHVKQIDDYIKQAILHEGFSVVEILTQCPTHFGRKNKQGSAVDMMKLYRDITTPIGSKAKQENPDLIERGIFVQEEKPEYCKEYDKIIERATRG